MAEQVQEQKKQVKKKAVRIVPHGFAYVQVTFNNTTVTVTDLNGNALGWSSAGHCGFSGPKKATPYAAGQVVKKLVEHIKDYGVRDIDVFIKGAGHARDATIRALNANGFNILSVKDVTPLPHNGCRPPRPRRI